MWQLRDLTGDRFGRLVALHVSGFTKRRGKDGKMHSGSAIWACICDCGNETEVRGSCLTRGETRSCGCLAAELAAARLLGKCGEQSVAYQHAPSVKSGKQNPMWKHGRYTEQQAKRRFIFQLNCVFGDALRDSQ